MIATLSFLLLKASILAILLYWCNDTPTFVTRLSPSPNQFATEIVSPLPCPSGFDRHILLLVYLFILFIFFFFQRTQFFHRLT